MQPAISYCHGAGLKKRVYALEKRVLVSAAVLSLIACLLLRYGGAWVVPFFVKSDETELLALSIHAMSLYALSYLVNWVDGCLCGYLTALGQAGRSFIASIMGTLVLPLVGLAVLVPPLGLAGVCSMPLFAGVLSAVLSLVLVLTIKSISFDVKNNGKIHAAASAQSALNSVSAWGENSVRSLAPPCIIE